MAAHEKHGDRGLDMKITRMKKGYVIRVTDTEFSVLSALTDEGMGASFWVDGGSEYMPPAEQRVITEAQSQKRPWMQITEDRRK